MKKLYRSVNNRHICGVCGGLGEYLDMDPTMIRLLWAGISLFVPVGIVLYIAAAVIIPQESGDIIDAR